jgi:hypothetical protein
MMRRRNRGRARGADTAPSAPPPRPEPAGETPGEDEETRNGLVRSLVAILLNVGVLTALVVYFGWVRSDEMSRYLGIDEAILGMTVDEYARRAVRSVFILPIIAGAAGLVWVACDHLWRRRLAAKGPADPVVRGVARWTWAFAALVFAAGLAAAWAGANVEAIAAPAFIAAPLLWAAALLLVLYGVHLRSMLPDAVPMPSLTTAVLRGSVAVLVAVGLFWSATNYAIVEGNQLGRDFEVASLPGVEVDSAAPLDISAPGVEAGCLADGDATRYRYRGLRLLESTGGKYFLVSDGWTPEYGVVVVLPVDGEGTRFTFIKGGGGARPDGGFEPC